MITMYVQLYLLTVTILPWNLIILWRRLLIKYADNKHLSCTLFILFLLAVFVGSTALSSWIALHINHKGASAIEVITLNSTVTLPLVVIELLWYRIFPIFIAIMKGTFNKNNFPDPDEKRKKRGF